jgi:hypothetical protein
VTPAIGMKVFIRGRTSADSPEGEIQDVNFRVAIPYADVATDVGFTNQVLCSRFTSDGDSGSIVVARDFGGIVGLHVAGSEDCSMFSPIQPIIDALGFQFVSA